MEYKRFTLLYFLNIMLFMDYGFVEWKNSKNIVIIMCGMKAVQTSRPV